jgi:hypothetical protein
VPAKTVYFEQIKKLMGWCPVCKKMLPQTKQSSDFSIMASISDTTRRLQEFQTSNVVFPANNILFLVYFMIISRLILSLGYPEYIPLCLVGLLLLIVSCYWFILKTFDAAVVVDKQGVNLQAFRLKKFKIFYKEIESVVSYRREKRSNKLSILMVIGGLAFCGEKTKNPIWGSKYAAVHQNQTQKIV